MAGGIDRLIHLLLRERLGGNQPPDLSRGIMDAIDASRGPREHETAAVQPLPVFRPWMAIAASIALVAAIGLAVSAWLLSDNPPPQQPGGQAGKPVQVIPSEQERANQAPLPPKPEQTQPPREPEPEPRVPDQVKQPTPQPEQPPEPPKPEPPKPEKDPVVEEPLKPQPEPQPEQPKPEQPKPEKDPVVEQPPKPEPEPERPPTEAEPPKPVRLGSVIYAEDKARLEFRNSPDAKWQDWAADSFVLSGMELRARKPVAVELPDGARFYFDGEIALSGDDKSLDVTIEDESVYFDVYGSARQFSVRRNDAVLGFRDAEVLAEKAGLRLQITCLGGEVSVGDEILKGGWSASLSEKGFSRAKFQGAGARANPLVQRMDTTFTLLREELIDAARVYHGEVKEGVASGSGKELAFGIELAKDIAVVERMYVRLRVRINGDSGGLSIGFGSGSGEEGKRRYFQSHHEEVKAGEWVVLRVPLKRLMDDGDKKKIWPGVMLHKFQVVLWDKTDASVEVDWFELGIEPDWAEQGEKKENK
ncbi:MAG: hypothetical protein H6841_03090 [Planctomycetes bacterium]|nr:hypothetical protein [Planctomycetota bacterium]MCB9934104.1 hypothetical protein [Planctomycetota bacterium]